MKYLIMLSVLMLSVCSCYIKPQETDVPTTNNEIELELLFEKDGCKVYRFRDSGRYRYYTTCEGNVSYDEKQGKVTTEFENQTVTK